MGIGGRDAQSYGFDFEKMRFKLISLFDASYGDTIDDYINVILSDVKEGGGKKSFLLEFRNYNNSTKKEYLKTIFDEFSGSIEELRKKLIEGGLEKLAASIEMQAPNKEDKGLIVYKRKRGAIRELARYELLEK
jgi:hypothetical protein